MSMTASFSDGPCLDVKFWKNKLSGNKKKDKENIESIEKSRLAYTHNMGMFIQEYKRRKTGNKLT